MKCPTCEVNKGRFHKVYGLIECDDCSKKDVFIPHLGPEFTTDNIKDQRREYRKDILQPWHNGVLSKEYVEEYGTTGIEVTKDQVEKAEPTYGGTPGYWNFDKGKGGLKKELKKAIKLTPTSG